MAEQAFTAKELSEITGKSKQAIIKRARKENWPYHNGNGKGGNHIKYLLSSIPSDIQKEIIEKNGVSQAMLPSLSPEAALTVIDQMQMMPVPGFTDVCSPVPGRVERRKGKNNDLPSLYNKGRENTWAPDRAISLDTLHDPRVKEILGILRETEAVPKGWALGKRKWIEHIAAKNKIGWQTIYRWQAKYEKCGIAGVEHRKSTRDNPKAWTPEALDWWISLCLKPAHRKIDLKALYEDVLIIEAQRRTWRIGCKESAVWWFNKRATPTMLALQKGGMRALDNIMPPILRDYSDLAPFEMLVGDQHRFDFWVVDDDTGQVFRSECFMWQDLRTRLIYGMAFDHHYDAHLCGLALRIGMRVWGCFNAIYTDNGKPELSKYMMGIMAEIRALGMEWELTVDAPLDLVDMDVEEINPIIAPGTHKKAIVKNAKAKMIEGTFSVIEDILRSRFRVSGSVKRLSDDIHNQDVDHEEAMKLAAQGRLLLASEFYLICYRAIDYYNREKTHRGVRKEWSWKPVPPAVTPMDCLKSCYQDGWRPKSISDEAADLIFLKKTSRIVQRGRISIESEMYEHDLLLELHGQRVDIRFNPIEADLVLVFHRGRYLCAASPVEYSSMKDDDLARRKIIEKRTRRKQIAENFRDLTRHIPDFREYSQIPKTEKVAALIGEEKRRQEQAKITHEKPMSSEQYEAEVAKLEAMNTLPQKTSKSLPARPTIFMTDCDRHLWCVKFESLGGQLTEDDRTWVQGYEAQMSDAERERWQFEREYAAM